jgi:hypothetical protein
MTAPIAIRRAASKLTTTLRDALDTYDRRGHMQPYQRMALNEALVQCSAALASQPPSVQPEGWRSDMEAAPKGKEHPPILVRLKNPLPAGTREDNQQQWAGRCFVAGHIGVADDGFDIGWHFAAPVGMGGFPDNWIEAWMPIPVPAPPTEDKTNV